MNPGHAMHAISISPEIEYWKKYHISMGVAEIFSILLERLTKKGYFSNHLWELLMITY